MDKNTELILNAIYSINSFPISEEAFSNLFSEVKKNSKNFRNHLVHLARIDYAVDTLNIEELKPLMFELFSEVGLTKTYDIKKKDFFRNLNPELGIRSLEVNSPAYVFISDDGQERLIQSGVVSKKSNAKK